MGDQIERGASAAPIPETLDGLRSQNRSYRSLCASLEAQLTILTKKGREYQEAVSTLDSEREANAILTDEIAALRAENARLREALEAIAGAEIRSMEWQSNSGRIHDIECCDPEDTKEIARAALKQQPD